MTAKEVVKEAIEEVPMTGYLGGMFLIIARTYPSIASCLFENIQNSIDLNATEIFAEVVFDEKGRTVACFDNGDGASVEDITVALANIARENQKGEGKYGQFSRGLISYYGKGSNFTLTTRPKEGSQTYHEFVFDTEYIKSMDAGIKIPVFARPDIDLETPWNSCIRCNDVMESKAYSKIDIDEIINYINREFRIKLIENKCVVKIRTSINGQVEERISDPVKWSGLPLDEYVVTHGYAGKTVFRLYEHSKVDGRTKGAVDFLRAGNPSILMQKPFLKAHHENLDKDLIAFLQTGDIEGEIISQGISFDPHRDRLEENDAYLDFMKALNVWYKKVGIEIHKKIHEDRSDEIHKKAAQRALDTIAKNKSPLIKERIKNFLKDAIGFEGEGDEDFTGNIKPKAKKTDESKDEKDSKKKDSSETENKNETPRKPHHIEDHEKNQKKKRRKNDNFGITLCHVQHIPGNELWEYDPVSATLYICTRHAAWEKAETYGGDGLLSLQIEILLDALTLHSVPHEYQDVTGMSFADRMEMWLDCHFKK